MFYKPDENRYKEMSYRRCGKSGLKLPAVSLGLWHNFGSVDVYDNARAMVQTAFDLGITHFDLANNYGPEPGSAELTFGRILKQDLMPFRDELIISSKAGYTMWPGPYGDWGSRKYLIASCDQSLKRMGLDYVDIFYHHRCDPETPIEESMRALDQIVRSGKAIYAGISNYPPAQAAEAFRILRELGTPFVLHQIPYNMLNRGHEEQGSFRAARAGGSRRHRLFAARPGIADQSVSRRDSAGFAGRPQRLPQEGSADAGTAGEDREAERDRIRPGSDAGRDGDLLAARPPGRDFGADRR